MSLRQQFVAHGCLGGPYGCPICCPERYRRTQPNPLSRGLPGGVEPIEHTEHHEPPTDAEILDNSVSARLERLEAQSAIILHELVTLHTKLYPSRGTE